jgi:hypothetical protein
MSVNVCSSSSCRGRELAHVAESLACRHKANAVKVRRTLRMTTKDVLQHFHFLSCSVAVKNTHQCPTGNWYTHTCMHLLFLDFRPWTPHLRTRLPSDEKRTFLSRDPSCELITSKPDALLPVRTRQTCLSSHAPTTQRNGLRRSCSCVKHGLLDVNSRSTSCPLH